MKVFSRNEDGSLLMLGDCFDRVPPLSPGESWVVYPQEPFHEYNPNDPMVETRLVVRHVFRAALLCYPNGSREVGICISPDSPDPQHLPGWRPDRDSHSLHQASRR